MQCRCFGRRENPHSWSGLNIFQGQLAHRWLLLPTELFKVKPTQGFLLRTKDIPDLAVDCHREKRYCMLIPGCLTWCSSDNTSFVAVYGFPRHGKHNQRVRDCLPHLTLILMHHTIVGYHRSRKWNLSIQMSIRRPLSRCERLAWRCGNGVIEDAVQLDSSHDVE